MSPPAPDILPQTSQQDVEAKEKIESFFGVYLLYTLNPKYKGRTYIGFTVDPQRRLKQHNKGKNFGGACRTSNRGPWEMILIVHGFPNMISALRFEWAWQHPKRSRRLNHLPPKKSRERMFDYNFRLLSEMLRLGPWNRLPLTVRWLRPDIKFAEFPEDKQPPIHISVLQGPVQAVRLKRAVKKRKDENVSKVDENEEEFICAMCIECVRNKDKVQCVSDKCGAVSHIHCLAERFRQESAEPDKFLPVEGTCPVCDMKTLWGDIIRKRKGCNYSKNDGEEDLNEENSDNDEGTD